jgi:uncharacterized membrane protein (DUF485 family)
MLGWIRDRVLRETNSHLLAEEYLIEQAHHRWVVYWPTALEWLLALILFATYVDSSLDAWLLAWLAVGLVVHGTWFALEKYVDRFVVTNFRVLRIRGVVSREVATMPIDRILDITVNRPALGMLLDYGHFTFETAAQEQGLREIRYIGHPLDLDLVIQRLVQRAGVRRLAE